uniref:Uncharacterized protein n=1 Tax=Rhizophora mucronata TaxID=61149 RepID=A0A2P2JBW6_RHIMU
MEAHILQIMSGGNQAPFCIHSRNAHTSYPRRAKRLLLFVLLDIC